MSSGSQQILAWALGYQGLGFSVFPVHGIVNGKCTCSRTDCRHPGKHPATQHGHCDASKDRIDAELWWSRSPEHNIGIATGSVSGLVVIDIDPRNGGDIPTMYCGRLARTGSGGGHIYYKHPGYKVRCQTNYIPGIDIKADGGFVVAAPSLHSSGERYRWVDSLEGDIPLAPDWACPKPKERPQVDRDYDGDKPELRLRGLPPMAKGSRNEEMFKVACRVIWEGRSLDSYESFMKEVNESKCNPPWSEGELMRHTSRWWRRYSEQEGRV